MYEKNLIDVLLQQSSIEDAVMSGDKLIKDFFSCD